jgi:hypothetical protein
MDVCACEVRTQDSNIWPVELVHVSQYVVAVADMQLVLLHVLFWVTSNLHSDANTHFLVIVFSEVRPTQKSLRYVQTASARVATYAFV